MTLLDTNLRDLFNDRPLLDRTVRAIALDQGASYLDALQKLHAGTDATYANPRKLPTLRVALEYAGGIDTNYVGEVMGLLVRRDKAVEQAFERAAGPLMLDQAQGTFRDAPLGLQGPLPGPRMPFGRRLEPIAPADAGPAIADPVERERRLARIRAVDPDRQYEGDAGRERFLNTDRMNLDAGRDMVRTAELQAGVAAEARAAAAAAAQVAHQLDSAIAQAADKRQQLKLLDAKLDELGASTRGVSFDRERADLRSRAAAAGRDVPLKLLDHLDALDDLEQSEQFLQARHPGMDGEFATDAARLEQLRLTQEPGEFIKTLDTYVATGHLAEPSAPRASQDLDTEQLLRAGVHPESHKLHQRVRSRMVELDRRESEYVKTLEEILGEGA